MALEKMFDMAMMYSMKGVVFTEFMDMVEEKFSLKTLDQMLELANVPSGGAYTSVGAYHHEEMISLVGALSQLTNIPGETLVRTFGKHLFGRFTLIYPHLTLWASEPFEFFSKIESHIHVEVLKLYPDAELPHLACEVKSPTEMELIYSSNRPFSELAYGLMEGCGEFFKVPLEIEMQQMEANENYAHRTLFKLKKS